eukprot:1765731-Amphidinium_carterae.1
MQYLLAGQRRQAQTTLRNNERAINTRIKAQLNGAKASPDQQRRFAEAKARKLPWTDPRTTRFVIEGVPFSEPMEEPGVPAHGRLGEPAPREGEEAETEVQVVEPLPQGGNTEAPPDPETTPAANETLALPTDTL